jgi:hypothetical protein
MNLLMRLLREPLFHFAVIGGLIFALYAAVDDTVETSVDVIFIVPERIDRCCQTNANWSQLADDSEVSGHAKLAPLGKSGSTV